MVHALHDGHGVGFGVAKVQADVGQLILLLERHRQGDVLLGVPVDEVALPARDVVGVVEVGQEVGRMGVLLLVAHVALPVRAAVLLRRRPACRGRGHGGPVGRVDKVRNARPRLLQLGIETGVVVHRREAVTSASSPASTTFKVPQEGEPVHCTK